MNYILKKYLIADGSSGSNGWARVKRERTKSRERLTTNDISWYRSPATWAWEGREVTKIYFAFTNVNVIEDCRWARVPQSPLGATFSELTKEQIQFKRICMTKMWRVCSSLNRRNIVMHDSHNHGASLLWRRTANGSAGHPCPPHRLARIPGATKVCYPVAWWKNWSLRAMETSFPTGREQTALWKRVLENMSSAHYFLSKQKYFLSKHCGHASWTDLLLNAIAKSHKAPSLSQVLTLNPPKTTIGVFKPHVELDWDYISG